ncbi:MAG: hypothetical protein QXV01_12875, partial [Candidatus Bathyarchaeia archaeon]
MILIVASNKDNASLNISKQILSNYNFKSEAENFQGNKVYESKLFGKEIKLVSLEEELVNAQNITNLFQKIDLIIFV